MKRYLRSPRLSPLSGAIALATGGSLLLQGGYANAQNQAPSEPVEEITVTGSRIQRTSGFTTPVPVTAVTVERSRVVQARRNDGRPARSVAAVLPDAECAARRRRIVRRRGQKRRRSARDGTGTHVDPARRRPARAGRSRWQRAHRQHSDGAVVAGRSRHGWRIRCLRRGRSGGRHELSAQPDL